MSCDMAITIATNDECLSRKSVKGHGEIYNVYQLRYDWRIGLDDNGNVLPIDPILIDM